MTTTEAMPSPSNPMTFFTLGDRSSGVTPTCNRVEGMRT